MYSGSMGLLLGLLASASNSAPENPQLESAHASATASVRIVSPIRVSAEDWRVHAGTGQKQELSHQEDGETFILKVIILE